MLAGLAVSFLTVVLLINKRFQRRPGSYPGSNHSFRDSPGRGAAVFPLGLEYCH